MPVNAVPEAVHFANLQFLTSAAELHQLPADNGLEIAFAGRSNAGKSTALNTLARQRQLARASRTPGRTQLINLFTLREGVRLVDLPGYGFAQVPEEIKLRWQKTLGDYLNSRQCLKGLVVLCDIRHPLKDLDRNLLSWANQRQLKVLLLLTKADKLSRGAVAATVQQVQRAPEVTSGQVTVAPFSSLAKQGIEALEDFIQGLINASV
ncbi:MAG: YihA family ribosome biogenesis GTP-binding protein [Gammaproteobacteria bacterium]|nr:YihA family ribosome biogenesis GTP-binding protein [Gammaproteobacteria bacterium]